MSVWDGKTAGNEVGRTRRCGGCWDVSVRCDRFHPNTPAGVVSRLFSAVPDSELTSHPPPRRPEGSRRAGAAPP